MSNKFFGYFIKQMDAQSTCKRATFLIEKRTVANLTINEWLEMKMHLTVCPLCTLYEKQSRFLQNIVVNIYNDRKNKSLIMDENKKNQIQKLLQEKIEKKIDF